MKTIVSLLSLLVIATASGAVINQPTPTILWQENGVNIKTGNKPGVGVWTQKKLKFQSEAKGFSVSGAGDTGIYVPFHQDYPWLCLDIAAAERIKDGYYALTVNPAQKGCERVSMVSRIPTGMLCIPLPTDHLPTQARPRFWRMDVHNAKVRFNSIAMQKEPPCRIDITPQTVKRGQKVTFTCHTQEPAIYVEWRFFKAYTMPKITLEKGRKRFIAQAVKDSGNKTWQLTCDYNGFQGNRVKPNESFKPSAVLLEVMVETKDEVKTYLFPSPIPFP